MAGDAYFAAKQALSNTENDMDDIKLNMAAQLAREARMWRNLRKLCGYLQNGSDVLVRLSQDDATGSCHLSVGQRSYFSDSFEECVEQAMKDYVED